MFIVELWVVVAIKLANVDVATGANLVFKIISYQFNVASYNGFYNFKSNKISFFKS